MKKSKTINQLIDILIKILVPFVIIFIIYFISEIVNEYAFTYFLFPFISVIVVFICGINIGKSLEKIKHNEAIGFFTKKGFKNKKDEETEFVITEGTEVANNKKIIKELENGEKVHIKALDFDDVFEDIYADRKKDK